MAAGAMKIYAIEAYGGPLRTDGAVAHFTVCAHSGGEAIDIVRRSSLGQRYGRFEMLEETGEFDADEPGIITQDEEPHAERA
jgi:hypothetical protein